MLLNFSSYFKVYSLNIAYVQNLKFRKVFEIEHKWMALNTELTVVTITTQE